MLEDFYDIVRRRKLSPSQVALAVYLRGKYCRFNQNPFYLTDSVICKEYNISKQRLRRLKKALQLKGLIKFDSGIGRGVATEYTMLDTLKT